MSPSHRESRPVSFSLQLAVRGRTGGESSSPASGNQQHTCGHPTMHDLGTQKIPLPRTAQTPMSLDMSSLMHGYQANLSQVPLGAVMSPRTPVPLLRPQSDMLEHVVRRRETPSSDPAARLRWYRTGIKFLSTLSRACVLGPKTRARHGLDRFAKLYRRASS
jgi:hypothetical protein